MNQLETRAAAHLDELIGELAEDYAQRLLRGERPTVDEYAARHPEAAEALRQILPALEIMGSMSAIEHPASNIQHPVASHATLGDFRMIRELGRGGMGVVYEAEQISLGRRVAVKVLPFAAMLDKQQLNRFKNEARAAGTLDHPNIVAIHSVGVDRGVHYYAMHLVEGESLAQVIERMRKSECGIQSAELEATDPHRPARHDLPAPSPRRGGMGRGEEAGPRAAKSFNPASDSPHPLPPSDHSAFRTPQSALDTQPVAALSTLPEINPREYFRTVARLGIQAAEALDHAHQNGVLHRDVKPANLLVECNLLARQSSHLAPREGTRLAERDDYKLWVTDFGLARLETDAGMTMTGDLIGTLRYMSPEQALAKRVVVDHRSDVYSLGATLYELLTLRPPFDGEDRQELLRQIAFDEPRKPRQVDHQIPEDLQTILLKAMEKNAGDRYSTAQELADDLRRFVDHRPIRARPPSLVERTAKWTRRHRAMVSMAAAALAVSTLSLLLAAILTLRAYRVETRQRAAAEANLRVASDSIDRMLTRVADDRYFHGDLEHAETVAADATEFYEKLLAQSDDPELIHRAAEAHNSVAEIWLLVDKPEQALAASRRSIELLGPLIAARPRESRYLNARGGSYLSLGRALWGQQLRSDAEDPWRQAAADFQWLADAYPHEPIYRGSLVSALNNLGLLDWVYGQVEGAEQSYQRVIDVIDALPRSFADRPEIWSAKAASLSNWAMLARERGDPERATALLDRANALLQRSLDEHPTDPVTIDFLYNHFFQTAATAVRAGQHRQAAKTVEALVWALPDRLDAYYQGAELLLECAELADASEASPADSPLAQGEAGGGTPAAAATHSLAPPSPEEAAAYRRRARELVAQTHDLPPATPERTDRFAWFLLACRDPSFRDPPRALELAQRATAAAPTRGGPWLTLALARYRRGEWTAADEALRKSIDLAPGGAANVRHWLLEAMIRFQQGRVEEARQINRRATDSIAKRQLSSEDAVHLAAEAAAMIRN